MYARGNNGGPLYIDDRDREAYLGTLGRVVALTRWRCLAYCLMDNHVHLLIETLEPNLGMGMQRLHGQYAQGFNKRHGRSGHVFQGRYGAVRVTNDEQLFATVSYIARNPVAAGLCRAAEQWQWSSHRATVNGAAPEWLAVPDLLQYFEALGGEPRLRYADLTAVPMRGWQAVTGTVTGPEVRVG